MKAIIYSRVSSTNDRQNTERQISSLQKIANANDWSIIKVFSEKISGAKSNTERNVLNECIEFAKNNKIDVILFSELSRLGRNVLNILEVVKYFADNNINAYFEKENLMLLDKNGKVQPTTTILISCLSMVAEIERENIKFRLNNGRSLAIEKGVKMGRKNGSVESVENKLKKYPITTALLKKKYAYNDILTIAKSEGEKISLRTIKTLAKLV